MVVLGGYPPGLVEDPRMECDLNFVRVFDLSNEQVRTKCHSEVNNLWAKDTAKVEHSVPKGYSI